LTGLTGAAGPQGVAGANGTNGADGAVGAQGPIGLTGLTGAAGPQGVAGADGTNGADGAVGAQGPIGLTGLTGVAGANGTDGINGTNGADGAVGAQGPIGLTGLTGAAGANGTDGINGTNGADGAVGAQGPIGLTGLTGAAGAGGVTTAGTNITITGTGTVGSPYVVNSTSGGGGAFTTNANITRNSTGTYATDDFVFGSPQLADNGVSGNDSRMFFDKSKSAFRAGTATGNEWDDVNVGNYSIALGNTPKASGLHSVAIGWGATASASYTIAIGIASSSSGQGASAIGGGSSSGSWSTAIGSQTLASGNYSFAGGYKTSATNLYSTAFGYETIASGKSSTAIGESVLAKSYGEIVLGLFNTDYTPISNSSFNYSDRLLVVGNGTSTFSRSNALTIYKNGEININDSYTLPNTDGTSNQVLTTDGAGNVSWSNSGTSSSTTYTVGLNNTMGGYIIYVTPNGKHGLVVATQDQGSSITGYQAANSCNNPALHNTAGKEFVDWRLPTKRELELIHASRATIGGFVYSNYYWSSTDFTSNSAYNIYFTAGGGSSGTNGKSSNGRVRSIRSF
jgi:hypothetical protein